MAKPHMSFRPPADLEEKIRAKAAEERRTVSQFIANLVEDALAPKRDHRQSAADAA